MNSTPTIDTSKLPDQLNQLRLVMVWASHLPTGEQAARENWTHSQFLADLKTKVYGRRIDD